MRTHSVTTQAASISGWISKLMQILFATTTFVTTLFSVSARAESIDTTCPAVSEISYNPATDQYVARTATSIPWTAGNIGTINVPTKFYYARIDTDPKNKKFLAFCAYDSPAGGRGTFTMIPAASPIEAIRLGSNWMVYTLPPGLLPSHTFYDCTGDLHGDTFRCPFQLNAYSAANWTLFKYRQPQ